MSSVKAGKHSLMSEPYPIEFETFIQKQYKCTEIEEGSRPCRATTYRFLKRCYDPEIPRYGPINIKLEKPLIVLLPAAAAAVLNLLK